MPWWGMTRNKPDETEGMTERIIIPVTETMAGDIDEFWHDRRMRSKSEAVRHLIQAGLDAERKKGRQK